MFKVILLVVLFNTSTGELAGMWSENGKVPAFPTLEACEAVIEENMSAMLAAAPPGFTVSAQCIFPGKDAKETVTTT